MATPTTGALTSFEAGAFSGPIRPQMPTALDERRVRQQFSRWQLATETWDDLIEDWLEMHIGTPRAQIWGIPDTSTNTLSELSRQLSIPGLYGTRPKVSHRNEANEGLVGDDGFMERAGFWTRAQYLQFLVGVLDDVFVSFSVKASGELVYQLVLPFNVFQIPSSEDPSAARQIWELGLLFFEEPTKRWQYVWHVYDKGDKRLDGEVLAEPSYRIWTATGKQAGTINSSPQDALGLDVSARLLVLPDGSRGARVGDDYPWRTEGGEAILPFVHYQRIDTSALWNTWLLRGAMRGALSSSLIWSYAMRVARDATGSYVMVAGLERGSTDAISARSQRLTSDPGGGSVNASRDPSVAVLSKVIEHGTVEHFALPESGQPWVHEVSPAKNLPEIVAFATTFEDRQLSRFGVSPENTTRRSANPASAASLLITQSGKRINAAQVEPVYRSNDAKSYELAAITLRINGIETFDERGYTTVYAKIPKGPDELEEERDEDTWTMAQGLASKVDIYRKRNPGTDREAALDALARVQADDAELTKRTAALLAERGLEQPEPEPMPMPAALPEPPPVPGELEEDDTNDSPPDEEP